jgi:putative transcriptional regulator
MSSYLARTSRLDSGGRCEMRNDVRERRTQRGLSQGQLATALAVSRQTINSIETGRYVPSLPLALALARYFETTVEEMFDASDE